MASVMFELAGEAATRKAGAILGGFLRQQPTGKRAFVLGLEGELGAGKTTFVRGLAKGLGIREKITSPSFLIAKCYAIPSAGKRRRSFGLRPRDDGRARAFWHFDFYRFNRAVTRRDLELLDFENILRDPKNIVAIEWAERVARVTPKNALRLQFGMLSSVARRLIASGVAR